jgi:hypothetical protein
METIRNIAQAKALACIDHKSLEICGSMQALAADFSGYAVDSAAVSQIRVHTGCLDFRISITALKVTHSVSLRASRPQ